MENIMDENIENLEEKTDSWEPVDEEEAVKDQSAEKGTEETAQQPEKTEIVGVRFKKEGKTYYFAPNGFTLKNDDRVIVDTSRGQEYGYVAVPNTLVRTTELVMPLRGVIRLATEEDSRIHSENLKKEIEAYNACIALIDEHNPKMKLIDVECAFDRSKMIFYFSAEERVDFREIVKALATAFRTRIEMRQIGIRDEAKMLGGLGVCGRPFCCSAFLTDFVQVSVKMAKEQNISLNAAKISGACGKLMCCLRYEYDTYLAEKALTPKVGARVMTPDGPGEVIEANPLAGIVKVRHDGKAEDSETTIYVREDVVREEEYTGETLTKTEIPKRGKSKDDDDVFSSFAGSSSGADVSVPELKKEEKPQQEKAVPQEKSAEQSKKETEEKPEVREDGAESADGGRNNRRRKKKHKGHGGGAGHGGQPQNGQSGHPQSAQNGQPQNGHEQSAKGQNGQGGQQQGRGSQGQDRGQKQQASNGQGSVGQQKNKGQGGAPQQQGGQRQNDHNRNAQGGQPGQNGQGVQKGQGANKPQNGQGDRNNRGGHHKKKHFKPYNKKPDGGSGAQGGNG